MSTYRDVGVDVGGLVRVQPCATQLRDEIWLVELHFDRCDESVDQFGGFGLHAGKQAAVDVQCDRCPGMTESLGDHIRSYTMIKHQGCGSMT